MTGSTGKRLAYLTAGAAGMYCGSCMQDNTLARGLTAIGVDVQLIPTYTPIRTDEENVSVERVFFGGISIYLEQKSRLYRRFSPWMGWLLDQPWLIRWATRNVSGTDPQLLGALTVSMLRGEDGSQRKEVEKLCDWLAESAKPDLIQFSNVLIGGCIPVLKSRLGVPAIVTLQGDDIFLESLPEPYRAQAREEIRRLVPYVDGFLVHSRYYAEFMADYLGIPNNKIHRVPLGIHSSEFQVSEKRASNRPLTIGYLARLAPEKGLHVLVDAFLLLRERPEFSELRLLTAGWLDPQKQSYLDEQLEKLSAAGHADGFQYVGSVDRTQKVEFLQQIDLLSVPTVYRDPKGIFVLEALAAGVPVVQPEHGAFPELITSLGGGKLVPPGDAAALADGLSSLLLDPALRQQLAMRGRGEVLERHDAPVAAEATWEVLQGFL